MFKEKLPSRYDAAYSIQCYLNKPIEKLFAYLNVIQQVFQARNLFLE